MSTKPASTTTTAKKKAQVVAHRPAQPAAASKQPRGRTTAQGQATASPSQGLPRGSSRTPSQQRAPPGQRHTSSPMNKQKSTDEVFEVVPAPKARPGDKPSVTSGGLFDYVATSVRLRAEEGVVE